MNRLEAIKIGEVYHHAKDSAWVRVVGWYGENSVAYETVHVKLGISLHGWKPQVRKDKSNRLYTLTCESFSTFYRTPTQADVDTLAAA